MVILGWRNERMARFYKDDFWGRVDQRLLDLGLSMKDISRLGEIPYSTLFRQKTEGKVPPKHEQIEKMAGILGCTPKFLLTGEEREKNTLSNELMDLVTHYKVLTDEQKRTIDALIAQFTRDNQKYAEIYLQLHPVEV